MLFSHLTHLSRAVALVMALLTSVPFAGLGPLVYLCAMTGEVGERCGCGHEEEGRATEHTSSSPSLSAPPCCELVRSALPYTPLRLEIDAPQQLTPTLSSRLMVMSEARAWRSQHLDTPSLPRGPPLNTGPPLFITHCSYLL